VRHRVRGGKTRIGAPITVEPGPDSHLLCYSIPDRASHIPLEASRKPLEAILVAVSCEHAPSARPGFASVFGFGSFKRLLRAGALTRRGPQNAHHPR
jgi:hypothetical protein